MNPEMIAKRWTTRVGYEAKCVKRNPSTSLIFGEYFCGYVKVPDEHPLFEVDYQDLDDIHVHGGLTYSGKDDDSWWFGFDCAHGGDNIENCPLDYVAEECETLAAQLLGLAKNKEKP